MLHLFIELYKQKIGDSIVEIAHIKLVEPPILYAFEIKLYNLVVVLKSIMQYLQFDNINLILKNMDYILESLKNDFFSKKFNSK